MPWIQQTNPDTMQPQWVFQEYDPFTGETITRQVTQTAPTTQDTARNAAPWWEGQGATVGGMVNGPSGSEKLGIAVDPTTNAQVSNIPKSVADGRGYVGWTDVLPKPFEGGFMDDLGANLVLPGLAALVGGAALTGGYGTALAGANAGAGAGAAATDALQTSALLGTDGAIASGSSLPVFSGGGAASLDFGQAALDTSKFTTGTAPNLTADALGYGANTGGMIPAGSTVNLANSAGLIPSAGIGSTIAAGLGSAGLGGTGSAVPAAGAIASTAASAAASGTPWSKLLSGEGTTDEYMSLLGKVAPGLISAYGSSQQADAAAKLAEDFKGFGAPSRARFEASMTPGFDPTTIPGYKGALDTTSDALLRRLSATGGNPFGNPGGLIEANKAIVSGTALPAVQEYQRLNLAGGGQAALSSSYPGAAAGANSARNDVYSDLGSAFRSATSEPSSIDDILKRIAGKSISATGLA